MEKPCPACGAHANRVVDDFTYWAWVVCSNEDCQMRGPGRDCVTNAIVAWNDLSPKDSAEVGCLRMLLAECKRMIDECTDERGEWINPTLSGWDSFVEAIKRAEEVPVDNSPIDQSPPGFADPVVIERNELLALEGVLIAAREAIEAWKHGLKIQEGAAWSYLQSAVDIAVDLRGRER